MRPVLFKKLVQAVEPVEIINESGRAVKYNVGQHYLSDFEFEGVFHQWGCAYTEFEAGPDNYTVGIIETPTGEVLEVLPERIKFTDR